MSWLKSWRKIKRTKTNQPPNNPRRKENKNQSFNGNPWIHLKECVLINISLIICLKCKGLINWEIFPNLLASVISLLLQYYYLNVCIPRILLNKSGNSWKPQWWLLLNRITIKQSLISLMLRNYGHKNMNYLIPKWSFLNISLDKYMKLEDKMRQHWIDFYELNSIQIDSKVIIQIEHCKNSIFIRTILWIWFCSVSYARIWTFCEGIHQSKSIKRSSDWRWKHRKWIDIQQFGMCTPLIRPSL